MLIVLQSTVKLCSLRLLCNGDHISVATISQSSSSVSKCEVCAASSISPFLSTWTCADASILTVVDTQVLWKHASSLPLFGTIPHNHESLVTESSQNRILGRDTDHTMGILSIIGTGLSFSNPALPLATGPLFDFGIRFFDSFSDDKRHESSSLHRRHPPLPSRLPKTDFFVNLPMHQPSFWTGSSMIVGFSIAWLPLNHRSNQRQVHTRLGEDFRWAEQPLQSFAVRHVHTLSRVSPLRPTKATLACISNMDTFASSTDARDAVNAAIKLKQSSKQLQQHPKFDEMEFRHSFPVQRDGRSQDTLTPFTNSAQLEAEEGQATNFTNTLHDEEDDENFDPMYGIRQFSLQKSFGGRDSECEERPADDMVIYPSTRLKMHKEEVDLVSAVQSVCMIADLLLKDDTVTFDDTARSGQPPGRSRLRSEKV
ncbi:hypothetical protein BLNAU_10224 [Blattamonas nauphoetae]|uniref:Uncharacterized protein n=1 Tax=Blattamonas nauphoetae TaxID=2049346 RepID=A0ABQ9XTU3_9EUKA|nr:hypothetical protein BLNAU_10224 [Blattamonas nauphoetae]